VEMKICLQTFGNFLGTLRTEIKAENAFVVLAAIMNITLSDLIVKHS